MLERMFVIGNSSLLFIASVFFFLIVIRVVRYKNRKDITNKEFYRDEINSYFGFTLVTSFLGMAFLFATLKNILIANIFFFCSFAVLVYFFYYTCKILYDWSKL